jgi:outer membrane protein OmpA-like peptidoglycan-associated protein
MTTRSATATKGLPEVLPSRLLRLLATLSLLVVAGCATRSESLPYPEPTPVTPGHISCALPDGPVGIAASARGNGPAVEVTPALAAVLAHAVKKGEYVALFDTDRSPSKVDDVLLTTHAKNPQALEAEQASEVAQLVNGIQSSRVNAPEADTLGALDLAARSVRAQSRHGTVVLMDSGLQTAGALRYQAAPLLLATGQDVVGHLRSTGQLPDLRGVTVILMGIGDTARPQARLDIASRNRLVEQWKAIAQAAGATCVHVDTQPLTGPSRTGLPHVSTVRVPKPTIPELDSSRPVPLREDSVGFEDNSDKLRDPALARRVLKKLAAAIIRDQHHVLLVGTTATAGTEQGRRELSLKRAEAVKRLLVSLGVPASRITARGVGTHYPAHVKDIDEQGNLIPERAIQNRAVFLSVTR